MIEIVIGVWLGALALSLVVSGFNIYIVNKHLNSTKLKTLNKNLEKINLHWSYANSNFAPLSDGQIEADKKRSLRQAMGITLLGLLSIPGFLILLVAVASMHFLAKTRIEKAVLSSELAWDEALTKETVEIRVQEINSIFR